MAQWGGTHLLERGGGGGEGLRWAGATGSGGQTGACAGIQVVETVTAVAARHGAVRPVRRRTPLRHSSCVCIYGAAAAAVATGV